MSTSHGFQLLGDLGTSRLLLLSPSDSGERQHRARLEHSLIKVDRFKDNRLLVIFASASRAAWVIAKELVVAELADLESAELSNTQNPPADHIGMV